MHVAVLTLASGVLIACQKTESGPARSAASSAAPPAHIETLRSSLAPAACRQTADSADPNNTPYFSCPGVEGYELIVRPIESGRLSVDLVEPDGRRQSLDFGSVVTRHRSAIDGEAEWRVATQQGKRQALAVMIDVQSLESVDDPAQVTRTLLALVRLAPRPACVVRIADEGTPGAAAVRNAAESAPAYTCLAPLPPLPAPS